MSNLPHWLTPEEVAEYLRVPLKTVYRWRYSGTGPAVSKLGRHLRYRRSDVDAWAASRSSGSAAS